MAAVARLQRALINRLLPTVNRRLISNSPKQNTTKLVDSACAPVKEKRNWVSYGFDKKSEAADLTATHSIFFFSITLCLVVGGFAMMYVPDYNLRDWSQREAFLELKRREDAGLPLIDPNLVDPKSIKLPSDEELGEDFEIII